MDTNFTDPARRALLAALEETERFGQQYIGTEHLLLGLIRADTGVAAVVLKGFGLDEPRVRSEVVKRMPVGGSGEALARPAQTPRTRKAIDYAVEEARALDHNAVGTGHLLLGLLRDFECTAARLLAHPFKVEAGDLRHAVLARIGEAPEGVAEGPEPTSDQPSERQAAESGPAAAAPTYAGFTGQARRVILLAHREAHRCGHDYVGTEHLLLGVLQERSGRVAALLQTFGVSVETVRLELEKSVRQGPEVTVGARLPLTPPARRALDFAREESARLYHDRVGPEHVLLGVLHEPEGEAAQALLGLGLEPDRLREEILKLPPPEDRDLMLMPAAASAPALAPDPSAGELESLVAADVRPARPTPAAKSAAARRPRVSDEPILASPSAAGLRLQLRISQFVLGGLAGVTAGALLYGRTGALFGFLAGVGLAAMRSSSLGALAGLIGGLLVTAQTAPRSPGVQLLAMLGGALVGVCLGDFLSGFAREPPPEDHNGAGAPAFDEEHAVEELSRR